MRKLMGLLLGATLLFGMTTVTAEAATKKHSRGKRARHTARGKRTHTRPATKRA
jgi:hypothetical protein